MLQYFYQIFLYTYPHQLGQAPPKVGATVTGAAQALVKPPLLPEQFHAHGPAPLTADAVPAAQRLALGATVVANPSAAPQAPLIVRGALHVALKPPLVPLQLQV